MIYLVSKLINRHIAFNNYFNLPTTFNSYYCLTVGYHNQFILSILDLGASLSILESDFSTDVIGNAR